MSDKKTHTEDPEVVIASAISRTEGFIEKNSKVLFYILIAIVAGSAGYFGWKYLYAQPREGRAADAMFVAEQLFAAEQWQQALDGDGANAGFLEIIDSYGSTPQGNLARQYAGICYVKTGQADAALEILAKYKNADGAPGVLINAQNYGLRGDLLSDKGEFDKALGMYRKAVEAASNPLTTPYYLKKAGLVSEKLGDNAGALAYYQRISREFGNSLEARDIDKSIGRVE